MIYLILAILCSSCITLVLKAGANFSKNRYAMLTCNYVTCVAMALIFMPKGVAFDPSGDGRLVLLLGGLNGVLFLLCMAYNQINVAKNGAILTATFVRLGVLVPTLLSIVYYKEIPTVLQLIGIVLVILAFLIMGRGQKDQHLRKVALGDLILLMFLGGITDSMSKIYEQNCPMALDDWYLLLTFSVALFFCFLMSLHKRQKIGWKDCAVGVAIGIPNYLSTLFLLQSLSRVPALLVYPTYSVGTILTVIAVSYLLFGEKLNPFQKISVATILVALLLLNI